MSEGRLQRSWKVFKMNLDKDYYCCRQEGSIISIYTKFDRLKYKMKFAELSCTSAFNPNRSFMDIRDVALVIAINRRLSRQIQDIGHDLNRAISSEDEKKYESRQR